MSSTLGTSVAWEGPGLDGSWSSPGPVGPAVGSSVGRADRVGHGPWWLGRGRGSQVPVGSGSGLTVGGVVRLGHGVGCGQSVLVGSGLGVAVIVPGGRRVGDALVEGVDGTLGLAVRDGDGGGNDPWPVNVSLGRGRRAEDEAADGWAAWRVRSPTLLLDTGPDVGAGVRLGVAARAVGEGVRSGVAVEVLVATVTIGASAASGSWRNRSTSEALSTWTGSSVTAERTAPTARRPTTAAPVAPATHAVAGTQP